MMLKYFLTRWLDKISGFALVFVKTFQMSVGHDDEIVVGQIPLEKGCRGEGTWISSWALDEVAPSIEAFGSVTVKYCGAQIIFQFCYIWSLSFFFFQCDWNYFVKEFKFHVLWKKIRVFPRTFAISHAHFEDIKVLGSSFLLWAFWEDYFQEGLALWSSGCSF